MAKVKGVDVYLKINTGTVGAPVWTQVGGQKDATFDRAAAGIDVTDKDSQGWEESLVGKKNWAFSFNAFLIEDDAGFLEIEKAWEDGEIKQFQLITPAHTYQGYALIEGLSTSGPEADASSVSFTLKGTAALAKT